MQWRTLLRLSGSYHRTNLSGFWAVQNGALDPEIPNLRLENLSVTPPFSSASIIATADDGTERTSDGVWYNSVGGGTTQIFGDAAGAALGLNHIGLRFQNITIPQGSQIVSATITINQARHPILTTAPTGTWKAWAHDDAPAFVNGADQPSNVTGTTATGTWNTSSSPTIGPIVHTVTNVLQEIVNRSGFASGNAVNFFALAGSVDGLAIDIWEEYDTTASTVAVLDVTFIPITGTIAVSEANDTMTSAGAETITGTIAVTEANDTSSASGLETITGTIIQTEANDTSAASGSVVNPTTGTITVTEANDTMSASGIELFTGTSSWTEANDTMSASGLLTFTGTSAWIESNDTMTGAGLEIVTGTASWTELNDTMVASGLLSFVGASSWTESNDTMSASGTTGNVSGTASWQEDDDTMVASGLNVMNISGTMNVTENDDIMSASGTADDPVIGGSGGEYIIIHRRRRRI